MIKIQGKQNFMGVDIPVVAGGFGDNKRCICDKTIAEIHNMEAKHVRENIVNNISRFKESVDFIDIKKVVGDTDDNLLVNLGYSRMQISKAEHIYLLSERGYSKLIKIMDTDLAWDIYEKLLDEYFTIREFVNPWTLPVSGQIQLLAQGHMELEQQVLEIKRDLVEFKDTLPLLGVDMQELTNAIHKVGIDALGGKDSNAYQDNSIRSKVYRDIHRELQRQYDVNSYKAIPRGKLSEAIKIVKSYHMPVFLKDLVDMENSQIRIPF